MDKAASINTEIKVGDCYQITYEDAQYWAQESKQENLEFLDPITVVGFLREANEEHIDLVYTKSETSGQIYHGILIPKSSVTEIKQLKKIL